MPADAAPETWAAYAQAFGDQLLHHRKERSLTQEALAHAAGMTRTHYQQLERGLWKQNAPANPSLKMLVQLAIVLDIAPGELLPPTSSLSLPFE